ncbi:MAG: adenylate/guanylate cyclase domain-containing protein [Actinomycetota bacterium]
MRICPNCGAENPEQARFCIACGTPLDSPGEERRLITALFADVVDVQRRFEPGLDPEDLTATLRPFHELLQRQIEGFGGAVEKVVGNVVFGVFGVPVTHEDDAERAVRAALRIREEIQRLRLQDPSSLAVRVGVATGEVVVSLGRGPRIGERVTGDVVNTASRLQSTAPPDGLVVAASTYLATRFNFRWQELRPVTVKGKAGPIPIWAPIESRGRMAIEPPDPMGAPFVGRRDELRTMRTEFLSSLRDLRPRLVTIVGDAGLGKSRLIAELSVVTDELPELVRWRMGRPIPYGDTTAYAPFADIVKAEAGILDSDPPESVASKLEETLQRVTVTSDERHRLHRHLLPLVTARAEADDATREETFSAWSAFVERLAQENPTILTFEDMHDASPALFSFLDLLLDNVGAVPLTVIVAGRRELFDVRPGWGDRPGATTMQLDPLSETETAQLVAALRDRDTLPADVAEAVVERSGGNPLYAEEFMRMLRDQTRRDAAEGPGVGRVTLPPTIQALLSSRLDALPTRLRTAAQDAAVVGLTCWPGAVAAITGAPVDVTRTTLEELVEREILRRAKTTSVAGQTEYTFRHVLVRDVAYGRIPRADRARKHRAVAEWLGSTLGGGAADREERLASHYAEAHDLAQAAGDAMAAEMADRAVDHLLAASGRAVALDPARSLAHARRALDLMTDDDPRRPRTLVGAGTAALVAGRFDQAEDDLRAAVDLFALHEDEIGAADATVMLARSRFERGDIDGEGPLLQQAIGVLEAHPAGPALAHAATRMAGHLWVVGELRPCVSWSERALGLARKMELDREEVLALTYRGASRSKLGDEAGLDDLREALRVGAEYGLGEETAVAYNNYAYELWYQRGPAASEPVWEEMAAFCEARGLETSYAWARGGLLEPLFDTGDWDHVLSTAAWLRGWDADHGGETQPGSVAVQFQGWVTLRRGDHETARACAKELMDRATQLGTVEYLAPAFLLAAEIACADDERRGMLMHLDAFTASTASQPTSRTGFLPLAVRLLVKADERGRAAEILDVDIDEGGSSRRLRLSFDTGRAAFEETWGDPTLALDLHARVGAEWEVYGFPLETALSRLGSARCLVKLGRADDARARLAEARPTFEALGAMPYLDDLEAVERALE